MIHAIRAWPPGGTTLERAGTRLAEHNSHRPGLLRLRAGTDRRDRDGRRQHAGAGARLWLSHWDMLGRSGTVGGSRGDRNCDLRICRRCDRSGRLPAVEALPRLGLAAMALVLAARSVGRIPLYVPNQKHRLVPRRSFVRWSSAQQFLCSTCYCLKRPVRGRTELGGTGQHLSEHVVHGAAGDSSGGRAARGEPDRPRLAGRQMPAPWLSWLLSVDVPGQWGWLGDDRRLFGCCCRNAGDEGIAQRRPLFGPAHAVPFGPVRPGPHLSWRITARAIHESSAASHGCRSRPEACRGTVCEGGRISGAASRHSSRR